MRLNFDTTPDEDKIIGRIADRILKSDASPYADKLAACTDITAVHCNGCPLQLFALLAAPDNHFWHDVIGIARHLDRNTGALTGIFSPRYAAASRPQGTGQTS